ncbi:MAG: malate dehydrogenase [Campylobacterota bacterium]|nr:malate dehydrogenase [Campylobacterota bacterium]
MENLNITFEDNGFVFKSISFDITKNILYVNQFDKKDNFIKKSQLKMGQLPKKIKQKLNPLKKKR